MERVSLRIRRLAGNPDLPLPAYESAGSAGLDIRACVDEPVRLNPGQIRLIPTGIAVAVPAGFEAQVRPRSGLALRHGIGMANGPGTIDSDYRGEIGIILINWGREPFVVQRGDRIAQLVLSRVCRAELAESEQLDSTARGDGGFGHTGIE